MNAPHQPAKPLGCLHRNVVAWTLRDGAQERHVLLCIDCGDTLPATRSLLTRLSQALRRPRPESQP